MRSKSLFGSGLAGLGDPGRNPKLAAPLSESWALMGPHRPDHSGSRRGRDRPCWPRRLWRDRVIAVGGLSGFTGGMVMMAINAFLPLYVQGAMGRSPAAAGLALGAASVSWTFASVAAGRLMIRTSYRLAATVGGAFLIAGTLVVMTLGPARGLLWAGSGSS